MQVINPTPFPAIAWPTVDVQDTECVTLLVRIKMLFDRQDENGVWSLKFDTEQGELFDRDQYEETDPSSVQYESDYIPYKPQGDLVVHLPKELHVHGWCSIDVVRVRGGEDAPVSQALIQTPASEPLGFVSRSDDVRLDLTGTTDEAWIAERAPLYPHDFDERHHNAAPEALQLPDTYFQPGDTILFYPCDHEKMREAVMVPGVYLSARVDTEADQEVFFLEVDTVIIERDTPQDIAGQLYLSYRRRVPLSGTLECVTFDLMLEPDLMNKTDTQGENNG